MSRSLSRVNGMGWSVLFPCSVVWIVNEFWGAQAEVKPMKSYCLKADKTWMWVLSLGIRSQLLGLSGVLGSHGSVTAAFTLWSPCFLFRWNSQLVPVFPRALLEMLIAVDGNRDVHILLQGPGPTALSGLWLKCGTFAQTSCASHPAPRRDC